MKGWGGCFTMCAPLKGGVNVETLGGNKRQTSEREEKGRRRGVGGRTGV